MRVLLDTTPRARGLGGTAVYVARLAEALEQEGVQVLDCADSSRRRPGGGGPRSLLNAAHDLAWRQRLAGRARAWRADVLHHPLPAHAWASPCPQVVTVHDLAFLQAPELFARHFRAWTAVEHRLAVRRAAVAVCVSRATREEVLRRWAADPQRVVVAPHGPGQWDAPGDGDATPLAREAPRHFLYVGDAEPRKDLALLLEGHRRYSVCAGSDALALVLAGRGLERFAGLAQEGQVVRVEPAPDRAALELLHARAAALVHVARLEGFGLTPLEAMCLGTPVLAAPAPAVREVCGDAARYLPGWDAQALAAELARLADSADLRDELARAGRARARRFSWRASAREHIRAYTLALGS